MHALDGEHFAFGVYALLNRIPWLAILSKAGVFTQVQPYAPMCGKEASSAMAKRMFGGSFFSTTDWQLEKTDKTVKLIRLDMIRFFIGFCQIFLVLFNCEYSILREN